MNITIVAFEGLGFPWQLFWSHYIQTELRPQIKSPVAWTFQSWFGNFQMAPQAPNTIIVLGHSFGGNKALQWAEGRTDVKGILTMDPRSWTCDLTGGGFVAPSKIPTFNVFRKGFMPGYEVTGAANQQISDIGHINVPGSVEAVGTLLKLLE